MSFTQESLTRIHLVEVDTQQLECDDATIGEMCRLVYSTHAAPAKQTLDAVFTKRGTRLQPPSCQGINGHSSPLLLVR